jgi:hypothetical protein
METPIPVPPPNAQPPGWRPTNSTLLAVGAGAVAQFVAAALRNFGAWDMDAETQLTVIVMVLANYFHPDGGRK